MEQNPTKSSQQNDMPVGQWSLTQTKELKCNFTWTIDNFKLLGYKTGEIIKSPCFSIEGNDNIKWRLEVYPKGRNEDSSAFVSLFLKLVSCEQSQVVASYVFSVLDSEYIQTNVKDLETKHFKQGTDYGCHTFIDRDYLLDQSNGLLAEDKLTICCEVSVKLDTVKISGQGDLVEQNNTRGCFSGDIGKLFDNDTLSDVTLVADGKEIRAHKSILAARSAVFAAMFQHDMQEQKLHRVEITDLDYDTLTKMLRYIYTDRAPDLDETAADLLVAGDKYALDSLKVQCEEALCKNLSVETAVDTLVLADLHSVKRLKDQTIAFINSRHVRMVMATEGWKKMATIHPHLVGELFSDMTALVEQHLPTYPTDTEAKNHKGKSEITFRYIVRNIKNLKESVFSPLFNVRNLPWNIEVVPDHDSPDDTKSFLGIFLNCKSWSPSCSCYAMVEFQLLSHKPETEPLVGKFHGLFSRKTGWGYSDFVMWSNMMDPDNGYVKDNSITLQVHVTAEPPYYGDWKKHTR